MLCLAVLPSEAPLILPPISVCGPVHHSTAHTTLTLLTFSFLFSLSLSHSLSLIWQECVVRWPMSQSLWEATPSSWRWGHAPDTSSLTLPLAISPPLESSSRRCPWVSGSLGNNHLVSLGDILPLPPSPASNPNVRGDLYHPNWVHCAIPANIPEGTRDIGPLPSLSCGSDFNKTRPDSALLVTFNGNIRLTDCSDCCMRWFVTINGEECTQPAAIDGVIYTVNGTDVNIHRGSTITGVCEATSSGSIGVGAVEVVMNLGTCGGFNETFDSYTSLRSLSTIEIKEMPPRESGHTHLHLLSPTQSTT